MGNSTQDGHDILCHKQNSWGRKKKWSMAYSADCNKTYRREKSGGKSKKVNMIQESPYKGSGQLTRQQFLFYEMRVTAKLMDSGLDNDAILAKIIEENLYQYPTEKTIKQIANGCIQRLLCLEDRSLVSAIANMDSETAKQICLYAMMKQYRLIWDFMITVIGRKYQQQDYTFSRRDINVFFMQLQEQDDLVASWSEGTIKKIGSVITRILIDNEYITGRADTKLQPVLINRILEDAIRESGQNVVLPAFNCLF